jgi:hypothetical protein
MLHTIQIVLPAGPSIRFLTSASVFPDVATEPMNMMRSPTCKCRRAFPAADRLLISNPPAVEGRIVAPIPAIADMCVFVLLSSRNQRFCRQLASDVSAAHGRPESSTVRQECERMITSAFRLPSIHNGGHARMLKAAQWGLRIVVDSSLVGGRRMQRRSRYGRAATALDVCTPV